MTTVQSPKDQEADAAGQSEVSSQASAPVEFTKRRSQFRAKEDMWQLLFIHAYAKTLDATLAIHKADGALIDYLEAVGLEGKAQNFREAQ